MPSMNQTRGFLKKQSTRSFWLFCLWLVGSGSGTFAFQPSHSCLANQDCSTNTQRNYHPLRPIGGALPNNKATSRPRSYPIFLASAGDEGVADTDIPMAVSLIGATTSAFVAGTFYLVLVWQRDALMVAFFLGAISNGILSKVLKRLINQGRPEDLSTATMTLKPSDGGMPSSHAMSLGFIGTFTALHVSWAPLPIALYVAISLWYRVQVKLHTWAQIVVGTTVGATNALVFDTYVKQSVMEWLRQYILDANGLLPIPLLVVPAVVGALVVGSVERRIAQWLKQRKVKAT